MHELTDEEQKIVEDLKRQIINLKKRLHALVPQKPARHWNMDHIHSKTYKDDFFRLYEKFKDNFSGRECEVMTLMNKGMTNQEIANCMFITNKSVRFHLTRIFRKLNVKNRASAIVKIHENL